MFGILIKEANRELERTRAEAANLREETKNLIGENEQAVALKSIEANRNEEALEYLKSGEIKEAIKVLRPLESNSNSGPQPTPKIRTSPSPEAGTRKTVYIQVVESLQRERAQVIRRSLLSTFNTKYIFPGVELVEKLKGKMPLTQVKYFRDEDRGAAEALAQALRDQRVTDVKVVHARGDSAVLEIWFSDSFQ